MHARAHTHTREHVRTPPQAKSPWGHRLDLRRALRIGAYVVQAALAHGWRSSPDSRSHSWNDRVYNWHDDNGQNNNHDRSHSQGNNWNNNKKLLYHLLGNNNRLTATTKKTAKKKTNNKLLALNMHISANS